MTKEDIYRWLEDVRDPEIPVLSLPDLGVIDDVSLQDSGVRIVLTPTFVGCPALEIMQADIRGALMRKGVKHIDIEVSYKTTWTSDRISEKGRLALKEFGLAPPPPRHVFHDLDLIEHAACPRCGNTNTELRNAFGPTLCRSIHYCNDCREAFEQFKPL